GEAGRGRLMGRRRYRTTGARSTMRSDGCRAVATPGVAYPRQTRGSRPSPKPWLVCSSEVQNLPGCCGYTEAVSCRNDKTSTTLGGYRCGSTIHAETGGSGGRPPA